MGFVPFLYTTMQSDHRDKLYQGRLSHRPSWPSFWGAFFAPLRGALALLISGSLAKLRIAVLIFHSPSQRLLPHFRLGGYRCGRSGRVFSCTRHSRMPSPTGNVRRYCSRPRCFHELNTAPSKIAMAPLGNACGGRGGTRNARRDHNGRTEWDWPPFGASEHEQWRGEGDRTN